MIHPLKFKGLRHPLPLAFPQACIIVKRVSFII